MKRKNKTRQMNTWIYLIGMIILLISLTLFFNNAYYNIIKYDNTKEITLILIICYVEIFVIISIFGLFFVLDSFRKNREISENFVMMKTSMIYSNQVCAVYNPKNEKYKILNYGGYLSQKIEQITEMTKELWENCVHPNDLALYQQMLNNALLDIEQQEEILTVHYFDEEHYRHFNVALKPVKNKKGKVVSVLCIATDVEEAYVEKIKLQGLIEYDNFTGLLNRLFFEKKVKERLKTFEKADRAVLILLDIDGFKNINDVLRHSFGDEVILYTANVLKEIFRKTDLIARLGGDEFLIWLDNLSDLERIEERLALLQEDLAKKLLPGTKNRYLSASVGAVIVRKGDTYEALYDSVDDAMYKSKRSGRGLYTIVGYEVTNSKSKKVNKISQTIKEHYILDQVIKNVSVPYYAIYYFDVANNNYYCYKQNGEITLEESKTGLTTEVVQDYIISYVHVDDVNIVKEAADFKNFKKGATKNEDGTYSKTVTFRRFFEDHYIQVEALMICNEKTMYLPEIITVFFKKVKG